MQTRVPDFLIAGAPRSGTTWLYQALDRHPGIYMAKPPIPEPKFFLIDDLYARGVEYYSLTWFANVAEDKVCGEKSTNYLESGAAAERIFKHLPGAKLVFILRDPVERAYSNYLWSRMNGYESEDFATALNLEDEREQKLTSKLRFARPHAHFSRGLYADLLAPYFRLFPARQILCLRYEDVLAKTKEHLERIHRFLGVVFRPGDADGLGVVNPSEKIGSIPPQVREALAARYDEPNRRLAELLGPEFQWTA